MIRIKRIYDRPEITDGLRILVDRLWPRGVRRSTANVDLWMKEIGPSDELRKWYAHEQDKWRIFKSKYLAELKTNPAFQDMMEIVQTNDTVTLLFATRDVERNNAVILWGALQTALRNMQKKAAKMAKAPKAKAKGKRR